MHLNEWNIVRTKPHIRFRFTGRVLNSVVSNQEGSERF